MKRAAAVVLLILATAMLTAAAVLILDGTAGRWIERASDIDLFGAIA
jgi:hypothetical protein